MAQDVGQATWSNGWLALSPWKLVGAANGAAVVALLLTEVEASWAEGLRGLLLFAGLLAAVSAVAQRLQVRPLDYEDKLRSAGVVAAAAAAALVGAWATEAWDSIRLLASVLAAVGFAVAGVLLLPSLAQRIVISLVVIFHFGGILTAVTSVAPNGSFPPWVSLQLWTRVYRHYLDFMYLNNAYHFYSPEPGPANLLWCYVKFDDGTGEWYKLPYRDQYATRQEYQQGLASVEHAGYAIGQTAEDEFNARLQSRMMAGRMHNPEIPLSSLPRAIQYRPINLYSQSLTASYARHVAQTFEPVREENRGKTVKTVKVYHVRHNMLDAAQMADRVDPCEEDFYVPYYHGEFDRNGRLLNPSDPFLYWVIPIELRRHVDSGQLIQHLDRRPRPGEANVEVIDYCDLHARGQ